MSNLELNPREVLDHLYELGYTNITAEQLKEFVKDLKKLIKYDQRTKEGRSRKDCKDDNLEEEKEDGHRSRPVASRPSPCRSISPTTAVLAESNMRKPRPDLNLRFDRDEITNDKKGTSVSCTSSDFVDSRHRAPRTRSETKDDGLKSQKLNPNRPCSAKENNHPMRSSSFIRPWKYQAGGQRSGSLSNRCDPVALYHKYQAMWQQNKIPGEENHSNLRWNIREKMLGQDPHPRSERCSCTCRCHKIFESDEEEIFNKCNNRDSKHYRRHFSIPYEKLNSVSPVSQASSLESMPRKRVTRM